MNKLRTIIASLAVAIGVVATMSVAPVAAVNVFEGCANNGASAVCKSKKDDAPTMVQSIISLLMVILGIISVIMIIIGGIRYTTSGGDASGVKAAKDTIIYAVVGLIVAILSYSIVNFVLSRLR